MEKTEVLKRTPFIRELADDQIEVLAKMGSPQIFEAGERLIQQGKTYEHIYIIEEGLVGIYLELGPMTRRQIQAASDFDIVGWAALLPPYRAQSTAMAIETSKVLALNGKELADLCHTYPKIGCCVHRGLASMLTVRLHHAYTQLMGISHEV